jgi:hypothetical protein
MMKSKYAHLGILWFMVRLRLIGELDERGEAP